MKLVQINATCDSGSTGKICVSISDLLTQAGVENYILYTAEHSTHPTGKKYMSSFETKLQVLKSRVIGNYGFQSKRATKRLIANLEQINPDIIHLHNIHAHNVQLEELFTHFKRKKIKLFWTFHDCWAFTGYCPHYDMAGCNRWQTGCGHCPLKAHYSWFLDRSHELYKKKKHLFSGLDLTIIAPSKWMANQVQQSFLKDYPVRVIHNGIDLSIFSPKESNFREKYNIDDKYLVLGVAFEWGTRKGLDVFVQLAQKLDSKKYQIALVGTNDIVDKQLPSNIISIHRTENQAALAEIYTAADVFVNPTREDTFPTTHIESLACGTPVIAFNTGGCAEILTERCGAVIDKNDVDGLANKIVFACQNNAFLKEDCVDRAKHFSHQKKFKECIRLYEQPIDKCNHTGL